MEKRHCIYVLENKINGKKYYGQTVDFKKRIAAYKRLDCKVQTKLYNAVKKYGFYNFTYKIIIDNLCLENANELEMYFIEKGDTINNGYNITKGGAGFKGIMSEETKIKMSVVKKGIPCPKRRKVNEIIELEIVHLYNNNKKIPDISRKYNISCNTITNIIKRYNVEIKTLKYKIEKNKIEIIDDYKRGLSLRNISIKFDISRNIISKLLKDNNIEIKCTLFNKEEELLIIDKYNNIKSCRKIAKEFSCSKNVITRILKKHNIPFLLKK